MRHVDLHYHDEWPHEPITATDEGRELLQGDLTGSLDCAVRALQVFGRALRELDLADSRHGGGSTITTQGQTCDCTFKIQP